MYFGTSEESAITIAMYCDIRLVVLRVLTLTCSLVYKTINTFGTNFCSLLSL